MKKKIKTSDKINRRLEQDDDICQPLFIQIVGPHNYTNPLKKFPFYILDNSDPWFVSEQEETMGKCIIIRNMHISTTNRVKFGKYYAYYCNLYYEIFPDNEIREKPLKTPMWLFADMNFDLPKFFEKKWKEEKEQLNGNHKN